MYTLSFPNLTSEILLGCYCCRCNTIIVFFLALSKILVDIGVAITFVFFTFYFILYFCRFDGKDFLKRWLGKKIMFVGDSLSLNMWESLACMLHSSVPNATTSFTRKEAISSVTFQVFYFSFFSSSFFFFHFGNFRCYYMFHCLVTVTIFLLSQSRNKVYIRTIFSEAR